MGGRKARWLLLAFLDMLNHTRAIRGPYEGHSRPVAPPKIFITILQNKSQNLMVFNIFKFFNNTFKLKKKCLSLILYLNY